MNSKEGFFDWYNAMDVEETEDICVYSARAAWERQEKRIDALEAERDALRKKLELVNDKHLIERQSKND